MLEIMIWHQSLLGNYSLIHGFSCLQTQCSGMGCGGWSCAALFCQRVLIPMERFSLYTYVYVDVDTILSNKILYTSSIRTGLAADPGAVRKPVISAQTGHAQRKPWELCSAAWRSHQGWLGSTYAISTSSPASIARVERSVARSSSPGHTCHTNLHSTR